MNSSSLHLGGVFLGVLLVRKSHCDHHKHSDGDDLIRNEQRFTPCAIGASALVRLSGCCHSATEDEAINMGKFLIKANYLSDGVKGLQKEGGSKRRDAVKAALESVGGTLDCMYYAFGDTDSYVICDLPDNESALAMSLMFNSSGAAKVILTPLMTPADVDAATAKKITYRAPGA
jgi:uncharacterized protein with GYD domain